MHPTRKPDFVQERCREEIRGIRKVAVARRRNGSDGVALGTVAATRDGYLLGKSLRCRSTAGFPRLVR